ncbi:TauD/TfdA family dioxygenase [Thiohalobacter sp. COW1]|uniref:TauD/TfdA family dioxygenase n=1 Tax=Thiohalobacter sp. COW1 TaxID=2795687 RepID=UPI00191539C4|nr:TauD/TfdA family dioxygenase [Thiohalobacter sp. COW1]
MPDHFDLNNPAAFVRWAEARLAAYPRRLEDLVVEIGDPYRLTPAEYNAMAERIRHANMALYAGPPGMDRDVVTALGRRFGLRRLDRNWLADADGLTPLSVAADGTRSGYIPYTDRAISWHTDGYYNAPDRQIRGLLLHCVQPAAAGGSNGLLDPELVYILLRNINPDYIRALMMHDALTIPAGTQEGGVPRPARAGPVFSVDPATGALHMRYTARQRNAVWKEDGLVQEARACLESLLRDESTSCILRGTLQSGMGLISNNVLHDRAAFTDAVEQPRLLFRGRYYDRIALA